MSIVLQPGLHYGIPARIYHKDPAPDPSLSSTIARKILSDSVAHAYLAHSRLGGKSNEQTEAMGLGSLVHSLMDDAGEKDYEIGDYDSYKGGDARKWRDAVAATGRSPVLTRDLVDAKPIAEALKAKLGDGPDSPFDVRATSEVTGIWNEGDAFCRARYDRLLWIPNTRADVWDWKTSNNVTDRGIIHSITKYAYHVQAAFYLRGLEKLTGLPRAAHSFTIVFAESAAPYTVRKVKLSPTFLAEGYRLADEAIEQWKTALETDVWSDPRELETFEAEMPIWMAEDDIEISTS